MTKPKVHYTLWSIANECFVFPLLFDYDVYRATRCLMEKKI